MTKKVAVILSGCGVYDGSEIHEATLTLLALDQAGASYQCFAPNIPQIHVINHLTGAGMPEERNVLVESARIARGEIKPLSEFSAESYDAIILPGGFGAAKNLSSFAADGAACTINKDTETALKSMHEAQKPIGALCIAPVILAKIFDGAQVTVGDAGDASAAINEMGADHHITTHTQIIKDDAHNLVTSPCYMLDASITQIYEGARAVVTEILSRI